MISVKRKLKSCLYYDCPCIYWSCWSRWRKWCKPVVAVSYMIILAVVIPLLIYHITAQTRHGRTAAWFVAGLFVLLTLPVFLAGLTQHVLNYTQPHLQKHIIRYVWIIIICYGYYYYVRPLCDRILWIVPIYSLNSVSLPSTLWGCTSSVYFMG